MLQEQNFIFIQKNYYVYQMSIKFTVYWGFRSSCFTLCLNVFTHRQSTCSFFLVGIFNSCLHHVSIVTRTVGITGLQKAWELLSNFVLVFIHIMTFNPGGDACNANRCHAFKTTVVRRVFLNLLLCVKCASLERLHKVRTLCHTVRTVAFDSY